MRTSALLAVLLALAACRGVDAEAPEGFAAFDDWGQFRAVSADGVMYRVRAEDNEPEAKLEFWKEALKNRMKDAGYAFVAEEDIKGKSPGYLLELAAPVGEQDYSYMVAVFVRGGDIIVAEASGEVTHFAGRRGAVVAALSKIK
jgi:hypothetical protein